MSTIAPDTELHSYLSRYAERFRAALVEGRQRWWEELLRLAPKVYALADVRLYRDLGWASFLDCMGRFGVGRRDAMTLLNLGRAAAAAPELVDAAGAGEIEVEKLLVAARLVQSRDDGAKVLRLARRMSLKALRRHVRQQELGPRVLEDGREIRPLLMRLSRDARAMAADLRARLSQVRERVVPWHEVFGTAVRTAARRIERGKQTGERRHRVVELDGAGGAEPLVCGGRVIDVTHPEWELVRTRPAERPEDVVLRHVVDGARLVQPDPLGPGGEQTWRQEMAEKLGRELKGLLAGVEGRQYRAARALALIEEWGLLREMGFAGMGALGRELLGVAPSTTSELVECGRVCRRFGEIRALFREGRIGWTRIRTVARFIDENNLPLMLKAMQHLSVRQLEAMARELAQERRPGKKGRAPERPAMRVEMDVADWDEFSRLQRLLSEREGREVSEAEVIEEALWQACCSYGAPRPLWSSYRILIYRHGGVAWQNGEAGPIDIQVAELEALKDVKVVRVREAIEEAAREEEERLAAQPRERTIFNGLKPPPFARDVTDFWQKLMPEWLRAPVPPPRVKRAVLLRAGGCCSVPGCSSLLFLHAHHIVRRASGGGNHPDNLIAVCSSCHGKLHAWGWALVRRDRESCEGRIARDRRVEPGPLRTRTAGRGGPCY